MKSMTISCLSAILALGAGTLLPNNATAVSLDINFFEPQNFSDFEYDGFYSPGLTDRFRKAVKDSLMSEAIKFLPEGGELEITFLDIDLAGEYEPWRMNMDTVRFMREIYPPRLKFEYRVLDAKGEVVSQGRAQLTDLVYLWNLPRSIWNSDSFLHEKRLLEDWASDNLPEIIKNGEGVKTQ